ncbi:MAG: CPBP family intramembrane metalloprotease [Proteobacteria bacterium]|nr:CPBP family intramembrane metalloprotease [Pseudomonadota bacterium]
MIKAILFVCHHTFQLWLFLIVLAVSLFFAFVIFKSKSIWPAIVDHLVGNFLISMMGMLMMILG